MAKTNINCRIKYTNSGISFDFYPGTANFDYWLNKKVNADRWKQTGEGIRLGCEITEDEADYIEKTAIAQWGQKGCEVIGRPAEEVLIQPEVEKIDNKEPQTQESVQLSLF